MSTAGSRNRVARTRYAQQPRLAVASPDKDARVSLLNSTGRSSSGLSEVAEPGDLLDRFSEASRPTSARTSNRPACRWARGVVLRPGPVPALPARADRALAWPRSQCCSRQAFGPPHRAAGRVRPAEPPTHSRVPGRSRSRWSAWERRLVQQCLGVVVGGGVVRDAPSRLASRGPACGGVSWPGLLPSA